jgi:hypothetical protein
MSGLWRSNYVFHRSVCLFFHSDKYTEMCPVWPSSASLLVLSMKHGTDKLTHGYIPRHEKNFSSLRIGKMNILEIGVGGYDDPKSGKSLRMWEEYFPNSMIYGIDIHNKRPHEKKRIKIFQ